MKPFPPVLRSGLLAAALALSANTPASAQLDPENVPEPPTERMAALERFFGTYRHTGQQYAGLGPWEGTLQVGPAVKGWYVEFVIDTRFGRIDRQLRMLITWDDALGVYRVWRFETLPQSPPGTVEAQAWMEGDDLVMDWRDTRGPEGQRGIFRNRVRMEGPDEIVIFTDVAPDWEEVIHLGEWRSRRVGRSP